MGRQRVDKQCITVKSTHVLDDCYKFTYPKINNYNVAVLQEYCKLKW